MAKQSLKGKNILVMGVETAPGRGAALQLSREGARVIIGSKNFDRLDEIAETLQRKKIEVVRAEFPEDSAVWKELMIKVRDFCGHIHMVVNAQALSYDGDNKQAAQKEANLLNEIAAETLEEHGPLKILTLWEKTEGSPGDLNQEIWHAVINLGPYQRLDSQDVKDLDSTGVTHLRAGAISDAVLSTLTFPPSALPKNIDLIFVPSSEKKKS